MYSLVALVFACSLIHSIAADCCTKEIEYQFMEYVTYQQCEGKDSANLTLINRFTRDNRCSPQSQRINENSQLLACLPSSKQTSVNQLQVLARSTTPNGAQINVDILFLVTSGPLEGKYIYERETALEPLYLKMCSSVLGYSYVSSKSNTLLIGDKLDLNALISPTGAFELFKKGCTTICTGSAIVVGPTAILQK